MSTAGTRRQGRIYPLGRNHHDHHTNCIALQGLIKSKTYLPPHPSSFPPLAGFSAVVRAAKRLLFPLHLAVPDAGCLDYETRLTRTVPSEMRNGQIRVCPTGRFAREAIAGCPSQNCAVLSTVKVSVVSEISQSVKRDASQSNRVGTPVTTSHRVCRCFCRSVAFLRGRAAPAKRLQPSAVSHRSFCPAWSGHFTRARGFPCLTVSFFFSVASRHGPPLCFSVCMIVQASSYE